MDHTFEVTRQNLEKVENLSQYLLILPGFLCKILCNFAFILYLFIILSLSWSGNYMCVLQSRFFYFWVFAMGVNNMLHMNSIKQIIKNKFNKKDNRKNLIDILINSFVKKCFLFSFDKNLCFCTP